MSPAFQRFPHKNDSMEKLWEHQHCLVFSGAVVTQECVEKLIKKDMIDPVTGDQLSEKDIIYLQRVCVSSSVELK